LGLSDTRYFQVEVALCDLREANQTDGPIRPRVNDAYLDEVALKRIGIRDVDRGSEPDVFGDVRCSTRVRIDVRETMYCA